MTDTTEEGTGLVLIGAVLAVLVPMGWVAQMVIVAGVAIVLIGAL